MRKGAILDTASDDPVIRGVRQLHALLGAEPRVSVTALQTVGSKGHDGIALALVVAD